MLDSESLSTAPREVTIAGKTYLVSKLELREWDALQAYLKDHATDPYVNGWKNFNRLREKGVAVADADRRAYFLALNQQTQTWPPPMGSPEWYVAMFETKGATAKFLKTALAKHNPSVTEADINDIMTRATPEESQLLTDRALGFDPAPKAEAPPAGAVSPAEDQPRGGTTGSAESRP